MNGVSTRVPDCIYILSTQLLTDNSRQINPPFGSVRAGVCYLEREQLERLRQLSEKTGAPMTHYMREGIALVLEKHAVRVKAPKSKP